MTDYCNGTATLEDADEASVKAAERVVNILGFPVGGPKKGWLHINRDPRGCALKLDDSWTRAYNNHQYELKIPRPPRAIYTDMGGYGILHQT